MAVSYLVTGAAGFIGFHLVSELARRHGSKVYAVDNFSRGAQDEYWSILSQNQAIEFLEIDCTDRAAVEQIPTDVDYIFHLAALNGTQNFYERPMEVIKSSTLPTIYLVEHFKNSKRLKRFVYAGTSESYAATVTRFAWPVPTAEDVPLCIDDIRNPRWSYAASKIHGEVVTAQASTAYGMPISIIRYHNIYGPRMGDKHVIPDFYERAKKGIFELYGYEDTRSFLYVDDAVHATILVSESARTFGEVVNIGSDEEIKIHDLAKLMLRLEGIEAEIALHPSPVGSVKRRLPNTAKLMELINFEPKTSLERGLNLTADFYLRDTLR